MKAKEEPQTTTSMSSEILTDDEPKASPGSMSRRHGRLTLLSIGHGSIDLYSSVVNTLQPLLVDRFGLSFTQAGWLGGTFMFSSAVLQLPFGVLADRVHSRLFSTLSPAVAGLFLSSLFWATGFPSLLVLVFFGGLAIAAFHPPSTKEASTAGGARPGLSVGIFITSGTFGLSLGPAYFSTIIDQFGAGSMSWSAIPAFIVTGILLWKLPSPMTGDSASSGVDYALLRQHRKPLLLHYFLVVIRSVVQVGMGQFLTLYLYTERGFSFHQASLGLSVFFLSAATGSFLGGSISDHIDRRQMVWFSMIAAVPFLVLFVQTTGWWSILWLYIGTTFLLLTIPVIVVMAQQLVPAQGATISALMMGFAWGIAGVFCGPVLGWLADRVGIKPVFFGLAILPLVGFLLALKLPPSYRKTMP
jgi:FSR family fosmidomycin resistance protein-like MFS transporter